MYTEDQLLPISALQHVTFCERQCALIHIERLWVENRLTVEGRILHEKVHDGSGEFRAGVRVARGLPLRSLRLGLVGVADVVEFHTESGQSPIVSDRCRMARGLPADQKPPGVPFPVEYKRGRPKTDDCDRVQLCAQALCLEEMFGMPIERGALYYGRTRHRSDVEFSDSLRRMTEQAAERVHRLLEGGRTPTVRREPKCRNCSMVHLCLPEATSPTRSAARYIRRTLGDLKRSADGDEEPTS